MKKLFCVILFTAFTFTTACRGVQQQDSVTSSSSETTTYLSTTSEAAPSESSVQIIENTAVESSTDAVDGEIDEESLQELEYFNQTGIIRDSLNINDHISNTGDYFDIQGYFRAHGYNTSYQQNETGNYFVCVKGIITICIRTEESRIYLQALNCTNTVEEKIYIAEMESDTGRLNTDFEGIFYDTNCLYVLEALISNESALRNHCCPFERVGVYHFEQSQLDDTIIEHND